MHMFGWETWMIYFLSKKHAYTYNDMILGIDSLVQPTPFQGYALGMHGSPCQSLMTP